MSQLIEEDKYHLNFLDPVINEDFDNKSVLEKKSICVKTTRTLMEKTFFSFKKCLKYTTSKNNKLNELFDYAKNSVDKGLKVEIICEGQACIDFAARGNEILAGAEAPIDEL